MTYAPLSAMILSATFFYLASQDTMGELFRRYFIYSGFLLALLSFGLSVTSSSELMIAAGMWVLAAMLFLFVGIDWLFELVKRWIELRR